MASAGIVPALDKFEACSDGHIGIVSDPEHIRFSGMEFGSIRSPDGRWRLSRTVVLEFLRLLAPHKPAACIRRSVLLRIDLISSSTRSSESTAHHSLSLRLVDTPSSSLSGPDYRSKARQSAPALGRLPFNLHRIRRWRNS